MPGASNNSRPGIKKAPAATAPSRPPPACENVCLSSADFYRGNDNDGDEDDDGSKNDRRGRVLFSLPVPTLFPSRNHNRSVILLFCRLNRGPIRSLRCARRCDAVTTGEILASGYIVCRPLPIAG